MKSNLAKKCMWRQSEELAIGGNVRDLHQSMMRDGNLKTIVNQFNQATTATARQALIDTLIYRWAGVENIDPNSRAASQIYGNAIGDAHKLEALEVANDDEWRVLA